MNGATDLEGGERKKDKTIKDGQVQRGGRPGGRHRARASGAEEGGRDGRREGWKDGGTKGVTYGEGGREGEEEEERAGEGTRKEVGRAKEKWRKEYNHATV